VLKPRRTEKPKSAIKRRKPELKYLRDCEDTILAMFQSLLSDYVTLAPFYRSVDSARDYQTIKIRLKSEGLGFLTVTLPNLMADLFAKSEGCVPSYLGWKKQSRTEYPAFLGRLFREVYEEGTTKEQAFGFIYQICVLCKKLRGPFSEEVVATKWREFCDVDYEIGVKISLVTEPVTPILAEARKIIETIFKDIDLSPDKLLPKPGPGATNIPIAHHLRYRASKVHTTLDDEFDIMKTFSSHSWDPVIDARRYMKMRTVDEPFARHKFVHKYLGKPRGICIEENEMQFFQQALKRILYQHLERHPETRGKINFASQEVNRNLAMKGSIDGFWATLDMSDASDRISRELVFRLFWNTKLFDMLDTLSTRIVVKDDKTSVVRVHKFAPMGSGICFPIEAVVHYALTKAIIKLSSLPDHVKAAKSVYVYGDDIVIPASVAQAVFDYLPLFGMKLNQSKSFSKGRFRESCGIHAYHGVDVTPVYVNHITFNRTRKVAKKITQEKSIATLLSLIAKEDQFYYRGLHETSQCIQRLVRKHFWLLPTVGRTSSILGFKRDGRLDLNDLEKYSRKIRYNDALQSLEFSVQTVVPRFGDNDPVCSFTDADGYLRSLCTSARQHENLRGEVEDMTVRRRWVLESSC